MVFLILGTQKFQFNRLLALVDGLVADGHIAQEVVAQTGHSDYQPKHFSSQSFMEKEQFEANIQAADLVITHGGVSSILTAMGHGKPVIVVPRRAKHGEHVDDHQLDIAHAFARNGQVLCCDEDAQLAGLIEKSRTFSFSPHVSQTENIVGLIDDYLRRLEAEEKNRA